MRTLLSPENRPTVLRPDSHSDTSNERPPSAPSAASPSSSAALSAREPENEWPEPSPPAADDASLLRKVAKLEGLLSAFAQALPRLEGEVDRFVHEGRIYGVFVYDHTFSSGTHEVCAVHELAVDGAELTRRGTVTGNRNHTTTWRDPLFRRSCRALLDYWEDRK